MAKKSTKTASKSKTKTRTNTKTTTTARVSQSPKRAAATKTAAKRAAKAMGAATPAAVVDDTRDELDELIAGAARALELALEPKWMPAIRSNLRVTLQHAALVNEFPLPDEAEPAPVFEA
jgi:hypothetical protein